MGKPMARSPLPLRVEHGQGETGYALLDRIAFRHRSSSVDEFLSFIPGAPARLSSRVARGEALDELAALAGTDVEKLRASSFSSRTGNGPGSIGAIPIGGGKFRRPSGAVCTRCIRDDIERRRGPEPTRPYRRVWWNLRFIEACPEHLVLLRLDCPACGTTLGRSQLTPRWCGCGCDLSKTAETKLAMADVAAATFLVRRVTDPEAPAHPVLDRLPWVTVASLLSCSEGCRRRPRPILDADLRVPARHRGAASRLLVSASSSRGPRTFTCFSTASCPDPRPPTLP